MGLVPLTLAMFQSHISHAGGFYGCRMLELGDQQMYTHHNIPEASAAKSYFEALGVKHVSIDLNGELGALKLDLSKPIITDQFRGQFDVVTDFGTSEHVGMGLDALWQCRTNVHDACRVGGLIVFVNPKTGHWPLHGYHFFTMRHYELLAAACGYTVLEISEHPACGNTIDGWQIHAVFLRGPKPFLPFDEFVALCNGTVFAK